MCDVLHHGLTVPHRVQHVCSIIGQPCVLHGSTLKVLEIALTCISAHVELKKPLIRRLVVQLMACDLIHDMY